MTYDKAELVALDKKYVWHHLTQHKNFEPAIYVKGEGMRITDIDGKTYLDAVSGGVWTVNVGYGRKEIVDAVAKQMMEMCYFANGIGNVPTIKFSEKLISKMPGMSRVYLSNSGSEANEKAFKIVRQIGQHILREAQLRQLGTQLCLAAVLLRLPVHGVLVEKR